MSSNADTRRLELDDLYCLRLVSDPQLSPDGSRVAFVVTTPDRDKDTNRSVIWIASFDGGDGEPPRPLTAGERDSSPRWSPDGKALAFVSARGEGAKPQIWLLPSDGGEARAVTAAKDGAVSPVWSPDGARLAFLGPVHLEPVGDDPAAAAAKNKPIVVTTVQYKSDGEGLLGDQRLHLFVCDAAGNGGGEPQQLTSGDYSVGSPSWSPDGSRLTFASSRHEGRDLLRLTAVDADDEQAGVPDRDVQRAGVHDGPAVR